MVDKDDRLLFVNTYGSTSENYEPRYESRGTVLSEAKNIASATFPLLVTFLLQYLLSVTTIYATGRLGSKELAAATLGTSSFTISGLGVYQGMSTCLDSFCSQAYGAGKRHHVGLFFQRCSLMGICLTIFPLSVLWWNSGYIFQWFVEDQDIIEMAQLHLRIVTFGAPGLLLFETGKRYLQAQNIYSAGTYILIFVAIFNCFLNWILVWNSTTGLGFLGAPIAITISYWMMPVLMLFYVLFVDGAECWGGLNFVEVTKEWMPLINLAIPGVLMTEAEYVACQIINFLAASMGTDELAAQSITSNVGFSSFQLSFALSVAVGTRLGQYVGKKNLEYCSLVVRTASMMGVFLSAFNFSFIFFFRRSLGRLFTSSEEVLKISDRTLILSAINQISDVLNVVAAGILRGQGRQKIGSILTMMAYYCISVPIGYYFGIIKDLQLSGLWLGYILGVFVLAIAEFWVIYTSNWQKIFIDSSKLQQE
ncbi:uncharacterized protein PRCAT00004229001 [Priceomyces carsonii]|uniref:uncharacterized protein n=1 Tax=Priceomyces carsonii TaxID=28549 RepID=UPI002EDA8CE8|nr:unnamed protein product [Priceomyces carsonii]